MKTPPAAGRRSLSLEGVLPQRPDQLYLLHRLCLRIFGLMARDLPARAKELAEAGGTGLKKKERQALARVLEEELPVLTALHALSRLAGDRRIPGQELDELLQGLLLPCFSLSYSHLYDLPADPLKHILTRVDWYLDGDKGEPAEALVSYAAMAMGEALKETEHLLLVIRQDFLPELDKRLDLAFRYEFS